MTIRLWILLHRKQISYDKWVRKQEFNTNEIRNPEPGLILKTKSPPKKDNQSLDNTFTLHSMMCCIYYYYYCCGFFFRHSCVPCQISLNPVKKQLFKTNSDLVWPVQQTGQPLKVTFSHSYIS